jgi:hypothetical protein
MFGFPLVPVVIAAAGLMDFGIVLALYLYLEHMRRKCSEVRRKWPQVPGKILSSRLAEKPGENCVLYSPEIRYEYTFAEQRRECERCSVYPKWWSSNRAPHQQFVARFPRGLELSVWVNPRDPSDAVLTTDPTGGGLRLVMFILAGAGAATLLMAVLLAVFRPGGPA